MRERGASERRVGWRTRAYTAAMKRLWFLCLIGALLAVGCMTTSTSDVEVSTALDAASLREDVVAAMNDLDSYSVEMNLGEGEPMVIEYKKPNSYRSLVIANDNQTGERTLGELLYVGDTIYARKCNPDGAECKAWDQTDRGDVIVGAASPSYFPQWPIVALEMADNVSASDASIRGTVNHIRAVFENSRRLSSGRSQGEECSVGSPPVSGEDGAATTRLPTSTSRPDCRELSDEGELNNQEQDLSFYDDNPATIEAEIDPESHRLTRFKMTFVVPGDDGEPTGEERTITFTYSKFNDVTIEAPE